MKKFDQVNEIQDLYDKRKAAILKRSAREQARLRSRGRIAEDKPLQRNPSADIQPVS
ncbi:MAG: hypothetical protein ACXWCS_26940 [Burkholderiales bacterium]